ncbi:uncharacterized protein EKO05_0001818 [Ascochyta rabiei]|uniref:uncharacterized protein n=1 Tax=Didymella rabiei TaxID=5454 RepID=UPI001900E709|nr:uncharacterized protein EKO05_0001818 [Ascochyta rabiei]UPX11198.1 hypothetical protein EKO05_0001818 [Ascochyta rabiei]
MLHDQPAVTAIRSPKRSVHSQDPAPHTKAAKLPADDKVVFCAKIHRMTLFLCEREAKEAARKVHSGVAGGTAAPPPTPAAGVGSAPITTDGMFTVEAMTACLGYATVTSTLRPSAATPTDTTTSPAGSSEVPASNKTTTGEDWGFGFNGCPHPDPTAVHTPLSAKPARRVDSMYEMDDDVYTDDDYSDDCDEDDSDDAHTSHGEGSERGRSRLVDGSRVRKQVWASGG